MSRQLGTTEWTRCPPAGVPVRPEYRQDLRWLFTGEGGARNLAVASPWAEPAITAPVVAGNNGRAFEFSSSATEIEDFTGTNNAPSNKSSTILFFGITPSNANTIFFADQAVSTQDGIVLGANSSGDAILTFTNTSTDTLTGGHVPISAPFVVVGRRSGPSVSPAVFDLWVNNTRAEAAPLGLGGLSSDFRAIGQNVAGTRFAGQLFLAAVWLCLLSPDAIANLIRNPWFLFSPARRRTVGLPLPAAQYLRPSSDASAGTWTASAGASLYGTLDEISPDDGDYITTTGSSTCKVSLGTASDPSPTTTPHKVRYRISSNYGGIIVRLKQGATTIATWVHNPAPVVPTTFTRVLSAGEVSSINYANALELEFEATT